MDALTYMYLLLADAYKTTQRKLIPWGLNSYTSFKISNVLEPSISQQCIYVVLFALPCMGWRALIECPEIAIFLFWMVVKIHKTVYTWGRLSSGSTVEPRYFEVPREMEKSSK